MADRSRDWLAQAERDLAFAAESKRGGWHEWACFAAQQAAEKGLKALHLSHGQDAWGHAIRRLLEELPIAVPDELIETARFLDGFYVPTRYANGHAEGAPFENFGPLQSEQAIQYAGQIVEFAHSQMASKE